MRYAIKSTLIWLILLLLDPAAISANQPLHATGDHGPGERYFAQSRSVAPRPASSVGAVDAIGITVADADRAVEFYSKVLSFEKVSEMEVTGDEYEHLQGIFGVRMRITSLHAVAGPGIELLEYLAPRDGRPYPQDAHANDLYHWQTKLVVGDATQAVQVLRGRKYRFISSGVIRLPASEMEAAKSFLVRDPDGHAMQLIEK